MPYKPLATFLLAISFLQGFAQSPEALINNLQKVAANYPQEKVYLQVDKPHYISGDDIWIKAYVTIGEQNRLSSLSRVLHVDLVNPANKVISGLNLLVLHGVSIGDFHLTDSLEQGSYHIRAYTNWMLNFGQQCVFDQAITIGRINPDPVVAQTTFSYDATSKKLDAQIKVSGKSGQPLPNQAINYAVLFENKAAGEGLITTDANGNASLSFSNTKDYKIENGLLDLKIRLAYDKALHKTVRIALAPANKIQFMPEGGSMVTGLQNRVAFKVLKPDGLGAKATGYIADEAGNRLTEFATGHAGMGSFYITPELGKRYKAVINYDNKQTATADLPPTQNDGYLLAVNTNNPGYVNIQIGASSGLIKNQKVNLLVQKQGAILFFGAVAISNAVSGVKLPTTDYPAGIIHVTLFNDQMQPQCERLFFNMNKTALLPLNASLPEHNGTRKLVKVNLQAGTSNDSLRIGSFSAAVTNFSHVLPLPDQGSSIIAGLSLKGDLSGYIEQPDYYFDNYNSTKAYELDNLIMCQGWRSISWTDVIAGKLPVVTYPAEQGFTVSGSVTKSNGTPVPNAKVTLMKAGSLAYIDTVTDARGHFAFKRLLLNDTVKFAMQATDASGSKKVLIKLNEASVKPEVNVNDLLANQNDVSYYDFLKYNYALLPDSVKQRLLTNTMLNQVNIKGQKVNKVKFSANFNGAGVADEVFTTEDFQNYTSIKQYLEGRALGIRFEGPTPYTTRSSSSQMKRDDDPIARPMQVYIDGTPMLGKNEDGDSSPDPFQGINVQDVQSIEILRNLDKTVIYNAPEGVILITMKTANIKRNVPFSSNYIPLSVAGYTTIRNFYSPDYDVKPSSIADHRATIYWKPDIVTDKNGNASFQFFTSDDKGDYQLTVEGMTPDGKLAHLVKAVRVE